ncbi:MAG: hypothetical protein IPK73_26660 [Candidatus Obscuribacter sp.]|nr:hypothetical protein [Candidatus Obscuribacter sp.]MBK9277706.1 hypothetical protein [Candidatus Obscuribacter sp.]
MVNQFLRGLLMKDDKNSDKGTRLLGTALFAIYPTLFAFAFNVLSMFTDGVSVGGVFLNTAICYFIFWYVSYAVMGIFDSLREEANRPREHNTPPVDDKKDGSGQPENKNAPDKGDKRS